MYDEIPGYGINNTTFTAEVRVGAITITPYGTIHSYDLDKLEKIFGTMYLHHDTEKIVIRYPRYNIRELPDE